MRKKINLSLGTEHNSATDKWIQLLIQRIIVEQLDVPVQLKARLLHQTLLKERNEDDDYQK
ncbi:hypothetical protein ACIQ2D_04640 [Lysinibacillus sp. NPDC097287]|uniref:hypothetical protein n=1 Tax=Lysinibacillus sp. NPDC097287 TaxID=3364144 RepID=UPI00380A6668